MDRRRADSSSQLGVGALFPFSPCLSTEHALRKSNRSPTLIMSASNEEEDISITWLLSGGWGTRQGALLRVFRLSVKHSRHFSPRFLHETARAAHSLPFSTPVSRSFDHRAARTV